MSEFVEACFSWPALPATVLLILVCVYWMFVILGALDVDLFDFDLDVDADAASSFTSVGLIPLKFLNIGKVPLMLWMSVFALGLWLISMLLDYSVWLGVEWSDAEVSGITRTVALNTGLSLFIAKLLTQPCRGKFEPIGQESGEALVGKACVITTQEATEQFGQAKFARDGAPLLLNVRTSDEPLAKDDHAVIVGFQPKQNIYLVKRANPEV